MRGRSNGEGFLSVVLSKIKRINSSVVKFITERNILPKYNTNKVSMKKKANYKIVNSKRFIISLLILIIFGIIMAYGVFGNNAYSVTINNVEVAKVKNKKIAETAMESLKQQLEKENEAAVTFNSVLTYGKVRAPKKELYEGKALEEQLKNYINYNINAFILYINDGAVACLKTKDEADRVLSEVEEYFLKGIDRSGLKEVGFAEKVEIKEELCEVSSLTSGEEVKNLIINGTSQIKTHKVASGESFWSISHKYGISMEDLAKANPGIDVKRLKIGQEINLANSKPLVSIKTVEEVKYTEKIPFEQKIQLSNMMYKNETRVLAKGEYGEKEVQADVTKVNGIETKRDIIKEKIVKKPKDQITVKGSK